MNNRTIAIYIDKKKELQTKKESYRMFTKIRLNHSFSNRFEESRRKLSLNKSDMAIFCLSENFKTTNCGEIKEMILYISKIQNKSVADICKENIIKYLHK